MQVYFSHSYRDAVINGYFLKQIEREDLPLYADQKTEVWCVAKLERYVGQTTGFISIIPRRATTQDAGGYSAYIAQELSLARRSRVPRLLFVDEEILKHHRLDFPEDAVPFVAEAPGKYGDEHARAIQQFRLQLETTTRQRLPFTPGKAVVVIGEGARSNKLAEDIVELLRRKGFSSEVLARKRADRGLDDIRLLETLWRAELCVFALGDRLSEAHVALAMAHAHCIPSVRLRHDPHAAACEPDATGMIGWSREREMLEQLELQLQSYREGLVQPLVMAQSSNHTEAMRAVGTMRWQARDDNRWDLRDGPALLRHVHPEHSFVRDEATRARREYPRGWAHVENRVECEDVCRLLYDGLKRHRFGYELEPAASTPGIQIIRTPSQISTHRTATCIDMSCLFAALLEACSQRPIIAIVESDRGAHALVGCYAPHEPEWSEPTLGSLRRAIDHGDALFFEATGAVESDAPIGGETPAERADKVLAFNDAKAAVTRLLAGPGVRLQYVLDVRAGRIRQPPP